MLISWNRWLKRVRFSWFRDRIFPNFVFWLGMDLYLLKITTVWSQEHFAENVKFFRSKVYSYNFFFGEPFMCTGDVLWQPGRFGGSTSCYRVKYIQFQSICSARNHFNELTRNLNGRVYDWKTVFLRSGKCKNINEETKRDNTVCEIRTPTLQRDFSWMVFRPTPLGHFSPTRKG